MQSDLKILQINKEFLSGAQLELLNILDMIATRLEKVDEYGKFWKGFLKEFQITENHLSQLAVTELFPIPFRNVHVSKFDRTSNFFQLGPNFNCF